MSGFKFTALATAATVAMAAPAFAVGIAPGQTIMGNGAFSAITPGSTLSETYTNETDGSIAVSEISVTGQGQNSGADLAGVTFGTNDTSYSFADIFEAGTAVPLSVATGTVPGLTLAAGESFDFFATNPSSSEFAVNVDFAFQVMDDTAAVPLPAGGALLLTALAGGAAVSRRRKS